MCRIVVAELHTSHWAVGLMRTTTCVSSTSPPAKSGVPLLVNALGWGVPFFLPCALLHIEPPHSSTQGALYSMHRANDAVQNSPVAFLGIQRGTSYNTNGNGLSLHQRRTLNIASYADKTIVYAYEVEIHFVRDTCVFGQLYTGSGIC